MRPLTGRELNEQHKALVEAGVSWRFTLDWLQRETDLWILERTAPSPKRQLHARRDYSTLLVFQT